MLKRTLISSFFLVTAFSCYNCNDDNDTNNSNQTITKSDVLDNYANIVYQSYKDSYDAAVTMQTSITNFLDNPTEAGFTASKDAWLAAREFYGQTEAYRESNGPIDTPDGGTEGQINAWPLDENYIDYVRDGQDGVVEQGIVNTPSTTINKTTLVGANEDGGDKNISTGWHAIEFLLWGQDFADPSNGLAGQRPYTDYVTGDAGTNNNQERRAKYLKVVTEILVEDLKALVDTWNTGGAYRTTFSELSEDVALKNILGGIFFMAGEELSTERMAVAVEQDQEDEHSCFSDNTHRDIFTNAQGVNNVLFGEYGSIKGASIYDLIKQENEEQASALKEASDAAIASINKIISEVDNNDKKFDILIGEETLTSGGIIIQAVNALKNQSNEISATASALGIAL